MDPLGNLMQHIHILHTCQFLAWRRFEFLRAHDSAGQNKTAAALCPLTVIIDIACVETICMVGCRAHRRKNNTVLQLQRTDIDTFKQFHDQPPFFKLFL